MPMKFELGKIIFSLLFGFAVIQAKPPAGTELLDSIATYYRRAVPFEISFSLTNIANSAEQFKGRFRIGLNNRFALLLENQEIHYDGRWLWSYDRLNHQVVVEELHPQTTLIMLLNLLKGDFQDFKITKSVKLKNKSNLHQLILVSTGQNAIFKQLTLVVHTSNYHIVTATYQDFQNNLYRIELGGAPRTLAATEWQSFKLPADIDLIDLRPKEPK